VRVLKRVLGLPQRSVPRREGPHHELARRMLDDARLRPLPPSGEAVDEQGWAVNDDLVSTVFELFSTVVELTQRGGDGLSRGPMVRLGALLAERGPCAERFVDRARRGPTRSNGRWRPQTLKAFGAVSPRLGHGPVRGSRELTMAALPLQGRSEQQLLGPAERSAPATRASEFDDRFRHTRSFPGRSGFANCESGSAVARGICIGMSSIQPQPPPPLLTKSELADYLRRTPRTIDNYVRRGMPHQPCGGGKRFELTSVRKWLASGESDASQDDESGDKDHGLDETGAV
jgi:hypothetical protein